MSFDCVSSMFYGLDERSLLNIHSLHAVSSLFFLKLVMHDLFKIHALEAKECSESFIISFVSKDMIAVESIIVCVEFMEYAITRCSHLHHQKHSDI